MNDQEGFHRLRLRRMAGATEVCLEGGLNKKVEEYQNGTQNHQASSPTISTSRNAAQGPNHLIGNDFQPRFLSRTIEGPGWCVARQSASIGADFIGYPHIYIDAPAPDQDR